MAALWNIVMMKRNKLTLASDYASILLLICTVTWISPVSGGKYGSWACTSGRDVVSSGSFQNSQFAPFISPQITGSKQAGCANKYYRDLDCTFTFKAPVGHLIYVEFSAIKLDSKCSEDFLDMYLGRGLRRLCGQRSLTYDISDGKQMTLKFRSNEDNECSGFAGYFTAFPDINSGRRKRRASPHKVAALPENYPIMRLASTLHKRRARSVTYNSLLSLISALAGVRVPSTGATAAAATNLHSALVLNLRMTWFRLRNFLFLRHCRRRVETGLWDQPACTICTFSEVAECVCRAPSGARRRRSATLGGLAPRHQRYKRFLFGNHNDIDDKHDCTCRQ